MVKIEEFRPFHFDKLVEMHKKQESTATPFIIRETLPKIGFIVSNEKEYIAAGFLRRLEGGFGQLDTFVTNPESSSEDRDIALKFLAQELIKEAKTLELRGIYVLTANKTVFNRSVEMGFRVLNDVVLGLNL